VKAFRYAKEQRLLQLMLDEVPLSGYTFEQRLLFGRGINTMEPKNLEAVLSTQFTGLSKFALQ
jgi:hypothetical protein